MARQYDSEALDELLDALGTKRRRYALYYARERGEVDVSDVTATVTDWLAARSDDGSGDPVEQSQVRTSLHHVDLPKLSAAGLVSYDRQDGTVAFEGSGLEDSLVDVLHERERIPEPTATDDDAFYRGV